MDTTEKRWRFVWAVWASAFVVAETIAIRGRHPHAPLSHHARKTLRAGETRSGALVIAGASAWLIRHLYRKVTDE